MPRPPGVQHFDILCNHVVFSPELVKKNLPADARYLAIVRHPLQQTISAFHYYRSVYPLPYLAAVVGDDPLGMYLADPLRWEPKKASISFTMNRMSFDFGLDPNSFGKGEYLEAARCKVRRVRGADEAAAGLGVEGHLVHPEQRASWKRNGTHDVTEDEKRNHRIHNAADYALYEHFSAVFDKRVVDMGDDFTQEVASFRTALLTVEAFCKNGVQGDLEVGKTTWDPGFVVGRAECAYMQMPEMEFVELEKHQVFTERDGVDCFERGGLLLFRAFLTQKANTGAHIYISTLRLLPAPAVFLQVRPHFLLIKWLLYQMLLQHQHAGCGYSPCSIELRCKIPPPHTHTIIYPIHPNYHHSLAYQITFQADRSTWCAGRPPNTLITTHCALACGRPRKDLA
ncbi:hypothetical protein C0Q70_09677 [Pomacea canaliculata]|uniref:Sulfotransferase domain-containing protein n=1 Tax=Pomacea canaliculata TaxID=400727 RepID=A0A2T7PAH5_POMCA|nr:hypothetical protein C0Q70_09677 [Pomacea canaliculata]